MRNITSNYKEQVHLFGRQIDSKITYNLLGGTVELGKSQLNSVSPHYESNILKSTMKQLDIDSNVEIPVGTELNYQFGVKVRSGKNLFNINGSLYGGTIEKYNNGFILTKSTNRTLRMSLPTPLEPGTYKFSADIINSNLTGNLGIHLRNADSSILQFYFSGDEVTFTLTEQANRIYIFISNNEDDNATITLDNVMISVNGGEYETYGPEYEYINYGNYVVYSVGKQEDTLSYKITCYDKMLYSMKDYESIGVEYPISVRDYITALCTHLGLTFKNTEDEFSNYDKIITKELYVDETGSSLDYTFRDVFDELAQVTASTICINEDTDELEIRYINDTQDTIDKRYLKDINVKFAEKYGPVNSIVLSRASESDNVYLQDEDSIELNGLCEIKIKENQIMNFNDRSDYLPDILEKLNGLEYYINDFSSTGITYYNVCDRYNIEIDDNTYSCIMFNNEANITQGLEELVHTDRPEQSETDYKKADKTDRKVNQTYIIADKQRGEIEALTSRTSKLEDETGNMYTIEQVNQLIQNAETGITNTFSEAGGNNIFRNTGLWFATDDENNPYEFWTGNVIRYLEENSANGNALLIQNGTLYQEQEIPNGKYTISFKYKKLINLAECKVVINDIEYTLDQLEETEFVQTIEVSSRHINIQFVSDTDDSLEVYDLMVNAGSTKLAYSQNQNETTTSTVNISKGITITSSDIPTTFKADADGVRIFSNDDLENPKTKFTAKGTDTDYLETDEAVIADVLIQRVGDHTWFTKI